MDMTAAKSLLVVSWEPNLARSRELLFAGVGYMVKSALGRDQAISQCGSKVDLLVLGHSVPPSEKRNVIACYRKYSQGPVLSLLRPYQQKMPEADFGVEASNTAEVIELVRKIFERNT